ncbi:MAG: L-threonylcarbamoyladenylate synthase [Phycisphaerales bacterium]
MDDALEQPDLSLAVARLRDGGLVAFPTETVYGLGADALNADAVRGVFAAKGRPSHNPLIVHVTGQEMARRVVAPGAWSARAEKLARAFWPGPLTLVLPRAAVVPDEVTGGGPTVAVRCPDHPLALSLLFEFGGPLVGPSANASGRVSPTDAAHVREAFAADQVHVLDGGACQTGIESTVVDVTSERVRILRPGVVGAHAIAHVLGEAVEEHGSVIEAADKDGAALASPGMLASHYAPRTRAVLVEGPELEGLLEDYEDEAVVVITHALREIEPPHELIEMPPDAGEYAARLYRALREADTRDVGLIIVERPPVSNTDAPGNAAIWAAVLDRLKRATSI